MRCEIISETHGNEFINAFGAPERWYYLWLGLFCVSTCHSLTEDAVNMIQNAGMLQPPHCNPAKTGIDPATSSSAAYVHTEIWLNRLCVKWESTAFVPDLMFDFWLFLYFSQLQWKHCVKWKKNALLLLLSAVSCLFFLPSNVRLGLDSRLHPVFSFNTLLTVFIAGVTNMVPVGSRSPQRTTWVACRLNEMCLKFNLSNLVKSLSKNIEN